MKSGVKRVPTSGLLVFLSCSMTAYTSWQGNANRIHRWGARGGRGLMGVNTRPHGIVPTWFIDSVMANWWRIARDLCVTVASFAYWSAPGGGGGGAGVDVRGGLHSFNEGNVWFFSNRCVNTLELFPPTWWSASPPRGVNTFLWEEAVGRDVVGVRPRLRPHRGLPDRYSGGNR